MTGSYACYMAGNRGTAHELGAALRALRSRAGLTTRALGDKIDASATNVSHWERGERLIAERRLVRFLDAVDATPDEREELLGLRRHADGPGQLVAGTPSIGAQLAQLIEYEQVARRITAVAPLLVPGLLQTGDYARATLKHHRDIDTRVALRLGRRDILTRTREPAELVALIDSEVLVRPVVRGQPSVMAEQLRHLLTMSARNNITIQIVQSATVGWTPILAGPFILLEFATATPVVHLEHHSASAFLWEEEDVQRFTAAAEEIRNAAMTPEDSSRVIAEIVNGMETTT